jgi:phosphoglycolate phosphatase
MKALLVDLDGTIMDSASGIIRAYRHTLSLMGLEPPVAEELRWVVGPPARSYFPKLLGDGHDIENAVRLYREHYAEHGLLDAEVYAGMPEALATLRAMADRLLVCTAKPLPFARAVLNHFGMASFFDGIYGAEFDGRFDDKGELIAHVLDMEALARDQSVMIGDRRNDIIAASRNRLRSIGVTWGYGSPEELTEAGATLLCDSAGDLPAKVRLALLPPDCS